MKSNFSLAYPWQRTVLVREAAGASQPLGATPGETTAAQQNLTHHTRERGLKAEV